MPDSLFHHGESSGSREFVTLAELMAATPPGWHSEPWTWEDEERDIRSRLCLCCGKPGHHQEIVEARVARDGLTEGVCVGDDGRLHDGHHRVIAAKALGIELIPLETRAEADARWTRDHGTHIWELRRFGDIPPGKHWDWIQMLRQEARDFVAWENARPRRPSKSWQWWPVTRWVRSHAGGRAAGLLWKLTTKAPFNV